MTDTAFTAGSAPTEASARPWLPIPLDVLVLGLGLLGMYALTLRDLLAPTQGGLWRNEDYSYGPMVLAIALWLLAVRCKDAVHNDKVKSDPLLASIAFLIGGFLFVSGRALGIIYFEVVSFVPMVSGMVLLVGGWGLLNQVKFPIFFLIFMVPQPGFIVDPISSFLKQKISIAVTNVLWQLGYPISHRGVIIEIAQYQLLVANACAGMRTLFTLESMGLLYLNLVRHTSIFRNTVIALLIVPISFAANMIRVTVLVLVTYYFGDAAGQGFIHGFAGMVLFLSALFLIMLIDGGLRLIGNRLETRKAGRSTT